MSRPDECLRTCMPILTIIVRINIISGVVRYSKRNNNLNQMIHTCQISITT